MSIKVYNAYEVKLENPWDFLWDIRDRARDNVRSNIKSLVARQKELAPDLSSYEHRDVLGKQILDGMHTSSRNEFDPDVTIVVYPVGGRFFIRLFADSVSLIAQRSLDFIPDLPEVVDFHYQNSCDKPKKVTEDEWQSRREIWDAAHPSGRLPLGVHLVVCNLHEAQSLVWSAIYESATYAWKKP